MQAAYKWLTTNYTLDANPGTDSKSALFYFYYAFAKVMNAYGEKEFVDGRGQRHNWRNELAEQADPPAEPGWFLGQQGLEGLVGRQAGTRDRVERDRARACDEVACDSPAGRLTSL